MLDVEHRQQHGCKLQKQHISIAVDAEKEFLEGWTDIKLLRTAGNVGSTQLKLDITDLEILGATLDGTPTEFHLHEPSEGTKLAMENENSIDDLVESVTKIYREYAKEFRYRKVTITVPPLPSDFEGNVMESTLHIQYRSSSGKGLRSGLNFWKTFVVADAEIPSSWFPCLNDWLLRYSIEITVPCHCVAVSSGVLQKQSWEDDTQQRKRFSYMIPLPCRAQDLCFASGAFKMIPGTESAMAITSFVPENTELPKGVNIDASVQFATLPLALFEGSEVLNAHFPLPTFYQVFVPPEAAWRDVSTGFGLLILSTDLLLVTDCIEQSQEARISIVSGISRQWFGHYIKPSSSSDIWLVVGLAAWLEEQYVKKFVGRTEAAYNRWRRRHALALADFPGEAPPLSCRDYLVIGEESHEYSGLFGLKAAAVVSMLERRAGEELFKRQVEALFATVSDTIGLSVDSSDFVENLAKATDFKNEWKALLERWVYGRGVPSLTLGFRFHRRGCYLEVGIQQQGSRGALAAALAADRVAAQAQVSTGVVKVIVREGSGATAEHPVHVGSEPFVVAELRVNPEVKKVQRKRGRKRKDEQEKQAELVAAVENMQHPVQWVRLDPAGEWPCDVRVLQPERTLCNQLRDSRDVVAQSEAIKGLSEIVVNEYSYGPVVALKEALDDNRLACRVRCEAAAALGVLRDEHGKPAGLKPLLSYYLDRYWDREEAVKPVSFPSIDDYMVAQAVVAAIASCSHIAEEEDAFQALTVLLKGAQCYKSSWGVFDDSGLLAALLRGLGKFRLPDITEIEAIEFFAAQAHETLMRYLKRELVSSSPWNVIGRASLVALVDLLTGRFSLAPLLSTEVLEETQVVVQLTAWSDKSPLRLRCAAVACLIRLRGGCMAGLNLGLLGIEQNLPRRLLVSIWQETAKLSARMRREGSKEQRPTDIVRQAAQHICSTSLDGHVYHLSFVILRNLADLPPTLYQPPEAESILLEDYRLKALDEASNMALLGTSAPASFPGAVSSTRIKLSAASGPAKDMGQDAKISPPEKAKDAVPQPPDGSQSKSVKLKIKLPLQSQGDSISGAQS